jgi:hypothetical protein
MCGIIAMSIRRYQAALLGLLMALPAWAGATELKPEAGRGFDRYLQLSQQHMEATAPEAFLWVDHLPDSRRADAHASLSRGEVVTERVATSDPEGRVHTPGAMIHDWVSTVFIPGTSLQKVLSTVQDYDDHRTYYSPAVTRSKILEHHGDDFKIYLRLMRKKIVTVVLDTEYRIHYQRLDANRVQSTSFSTRIAEVEHPGAPDETQLPVENDHGFLWRLDSFWRFYQGDGGVYVQCEAISLSRDIPLGLNWLIRPFIESVPRESLEFIMQSTRSAVMGGTQRP